MAGPLGSLALGREKLIMRLGSACIARASRGVQTVLWRSCSQYKQVATNEDLPVTMENPYKEPNKKCILCGKPVDYKNVQLLSQFVSPFTGCIYGRHITGLCGKKQKEITKAIKRAQIMASLGCSTRKRISGSKKVKRFMPVTYKDPDYLKDPKICNIKY